VRRSGAEQSRVLLLGWWDAEPTHGGFFSSRGFAGAELGALEAGAAQGCWFGRSQAGERSCVGLASLCGGVAWGAGVDGHCVEPGLRLSPVTSGAWSQQVPQEAGGQEGCPGERGGRSPQGLASGMERAEQLMVKCCFSPLRILFKASAGEKRSPWDMKVLASHGGSALHAGTVRELGGGRNGCAIVALP